MLDHMKRRTIRLDKVSTVVLDEADEMLDMGFFKDVRKILDSLPKKEQMVMCSATISREVARGGVRERGPLHQGDAEGAGLAGAGGGLGDNLPAGEHDGDGLFLDLRHLGKAHILHRTRRGSGWPPSMVDKL